MQKPSLHKFQSSLSFIRNCSTSMSLASTPPPVTKTLAARLGRQYKMFSKCSSSAYLRRRIPRRPGRATLTLLVLFVLVLGITLTCLNIYEMDRIKADHDLHVAELSRIPELEAQISDKMNRSTPIVWIQGSLKWTDKGPTGYLKHVYRVFHKLGFTTGDSASDWLIMWAHDYPFVTYAAEMKALKPYQRVNHFPGSGYITNKVNLAQIKLDVIPRAFDIPGKKQQFLSYTQKHPNTSWVQKNNKHRGIKVKAVKDVDLTLAGTFVQEFVARPFLIDSRKFDIGVYTVLTSIDPLRVYTIDGDALFRFCAQEYYPFDSAVLDKYVVGDDYRPMWQQPSLEDLHVDHEFSFKNTFNQYLRQNGKDYKLLWKRIKTAIRDVFLAKEHDLIKAVQYYRSKRNFFEMVRLDFVVDENLNPFLMEANMSPNLASDHFPPNERLYEHVIFNLLGLMGIGHFTGTDDQKASAMDKAMVVSPQDIYVFPDHCNRQECSKDCKRLVCRLCRNCLSQAMELELKAAYVEHMQRGSARRIFPPPISPSEASSLVLDKGAPPLALLKGLNLKNQLMTLWFIGKCRLDSAWCY